MGIKKFVIFMMSISAAAVVLVILGSIGLDIPFLRQIVGFSFLTLVPGLLLLRILKFRQLGFIDHLLYAVGISIALVMFLGLFMNVVYPSLGINRPIAALPLTITLAVVVIGLSALAYFRERQEPYQPVARPPFAWKGIVSPPIMLLVMLPLLSILGAYMVNAYGDNTLLLVALGVIALVAILIGLNRFIPPTLYPLAIVMISIALLWHWSLISGYLWGYDIHHEHYFQSQVLSNGVWNADLRSNVNSMLSVVILAPAYSLVLGVDSVWIIKIVYPVFFSLLPLALFQVFRRQSNERIGFLAVFLFISYSVFFSDMAQLGRQQIAEVFFGLFVMALLDNAMTDGKKRLLLVVFGMAIVVSHYGLAYFFLFYLVISAFLLVLLRNRYLNNRWDNVRTRFSRGSEEGSLDTSAVSLTTTMIFLMIVFCFAWYMYIGSGSPVNSLVNIGVNTINNLQDLFVVESREAAALMAIGLAQPEIISAPRNVFLVLQYVIQLFIIIGVAGVTLRFIKSRFQLLFIAMSLVSLVLLAMCLILPRFSMNFNIGRFYHIALMFLSPYCIIGGINVLGWLRRLVSLNLSRVYTSPVFLKLVGILIVVPYFLFNTGVVYSLTGGKVTSMALNPDLDNPRYNPMEISAKEWLLSNIAENHRVMADIYGTTWLVEPSLRLEDFWGDTETVSDYAYIYLRTINARQGLVVASREGPRTYINLPESEFGRKVLAHASRIYSSGDAQVYEVASP